MTAETNQGKKRAFSYEDLGAFLRFLIEDVKITKQEHFAVITDKLFDSADPVTIGAAKRASDLYTDVGERLLSMHLDSGRKTHQARKIAENLNKSFFAHGDAISRKRARELDLKVAAEDPHLEGLMWAAYLGLEDYMKLREKFEPLELYFADADAEKSLKFPKSINLPPNTPQQIAQQVWQGVMSNALQDVPEGDFSGVNAVVESSRVASEFRTKGTISAFRKPDGEIKISVVPKSTGWKPVHLNMSSETNTDRNG